LFPDRDGVHKQIIQIAVNRAGDEVVVLLKDARHHAIITTYAYPSLSLTRTVRLQSLAGAIGFGSDDRSPLVAVVDANRGILAKLDGPTLSRVVQSHEGHIGWAVSTRAGLAIVTTIVASSVIARMAGAAAQQKVEYSGAYSQPVFSERGDALLETRAVDGRLVVSLQRPGELPRPLTSGPEDAYPSFGPDGRWFVYVAIATNSIEGCKLSSVGLAACTTVVTDPEGPRFARISPDGKTVLYATAYGAGARIRVVSALGGRASDLGASSGRCPPVWSSVTGVSIYQPDMREWAEIDSVTGRRSGRTYRSKGSLEPCDDPPRAESSPRAPEVQRVQKVFTQVRLADGW
jgi:hypothetical protein